MRIARFAPASEEPDRALRRFGLRSFRAPFSTELLHLPHVLFRYRVEWTTLLGRGRASEGLFLADLIQGLPVNVLRTTALAVPESLRPSFAPFADLLLPGSRTKRTVAVEDRDVPEASVLPASLGEEEAMTRAKGVYKYDLLRVAGGLRLRRFAIVLGAERLPLYYPFRLVYHKDKHGRMAFAAFDAVTDERERGAPARSIKLGLLAQAGKMEVR
jgi:hypothetical protein